MLTVGSAFFVCLWTWSKYESETDSSDAPHPFLQKPRLTAVNVPDFVRLTAKSALFAVDVSLFGTLTTVPISVMSRVDECYVAGKVPCCRRWWANASQVLIFLLTCDSNRPSVHSSVAGRPIFGDLRQYGTPPATEGKALPPARALRVAFVSIRRTQCSGLLPRSCTLVLYFG